MKTIYLVRHGRTRSNEEGRFQGWEDHPLSPVGQEQALSLKKRARDLIEMYPLYWTPSKEGTFCVIRLNLS